MARRQTGSPTVQDYMRWGVTRYARNLYNLGYDDATVRAFVERRYPQLTGSQYQALHVRFDQSRRAASLFAGLRPDQALAPSAYGRADPGCTQWRYFAVVSFIDPVSGAADALPVTIQRADSQTPAQVQAAARADFARAQQHGGRGRPGYPIDPAAVAGAVHVIAVERACP